PRHFSAFPAGNQVIDLTVGDLNGDGRDDLIALGGDNFDSVAILMSTTAPGDAVPTFMPPVSDLHAGYGMRIADMNGDGRLDLVSVGAGGDSASIHLNTTPKGSLQPR